MSAATLVELSLIMEARHGAEGVRNLDLFISKAGIAIVPVDAEQAYLARQAFRDYGRGRHPAGLNYGDCFSYALASSLDQPLLFEGEEFSKTDIGSASV